MSPSSSPSPAHERDAQLLAVGKQCSDPTCLLVDFLPFKCQHCELSFCQEHFKVNAHHCLKYDESKHNRVAPNCPLCNTPVAVRPGQDPNMRMDSHLEKECSVVTGKVKSKSTPLCARATCRKVLFSPIRCTTCKQQFCPAHRFPGDHTCSAAPTASGTRNGASYPSLADLNAGAKQLNAKATIAGHAALGAIKTSIAAASAPGPASRPPSSLTSSKVMPFTGMDRLPVSPSAVLASPTLIHDNPMGSSPTTPTEPIIKPEPIINTLLSNFIPRPIFGTA
ncbi:hypothetical protein BDN70DRAFT_873766 [Pholiota conissans]|uniref:AN1-type domain-containing protein n=1 Tax=Pholiota conissans TaxID=109636 RepID=A0A9P5ZCL4_9AGAR|nr:hypothetical protein BDN70DRAFT_873766 [Pholiota conissans]